MNLIDRFFINVYDFYQKREDFISARFSVLVIMVAITMVNAMLILFSLANLFDLEVSILSFEGTFKKEKGMLMLAVFLLPIFYLLKKRYSEKK